MLPKLESSWKFLKSLTPEDRSWWYRATQYVECDGIPIYNLNANDWVGKGWPFDEYKKTEIDFYGYCPSETALKYIAKPLIGSKNKYMVIAYGTKKSIADITDNYRYYYDEKGNNTYMNYLDYVDKYGHPTTQYDEFLIAFDIYKLIE